MKNKNLKQVSNQRWFVTGSTGFVGREFICQLLSEGIRPSAITVLVRDGASNTARERFELSLGNIADRGSLKQIKVLAGDVTRENFGLNNDNWQAVAQSTHLAHLAAITNFDVDLKVARQHNVFGVKNMIRLAQMAKQNGNLEHWAHVSTAYVVGNRTDKIKPGELDYGQGFRNAYEQSKNEAEQLLQPLLQAFPLTIFRPSIIIGHSLTGKAGNFNTVYWAIRNYLSGQTKVYAKPDTPLDLVPVDYVVKAMSKLLMDRRSIGKIITLAGGDKTTVSLYTFAEQICCYMDSPLPEIVDPAKLKRMRLILAAAKLSKRHCQFIRQAESYLPYFSQNPTFDTQQTEWLLDGSGICVPPLNSYINNILDFCLQQNWGRRSKMVGMGYRIQKLANG